MLRFFQEGLLICRGIYIHLVTNECLIIFQIKSYFIDNFHIFSFLYLHSNGWLIDCTSVPLHFIPKRFRLKTIIIQVTALVVKLIYYIIQSTLLVHPLTIRQTKKIFLTFIIEMASIRIHMTTFLYLQYFIVTFSSALSSFVAKL